MKKISFLKVDATGNEKLAGAVFDLYAVTVKNGKEVQQTPALYTGLTSNEYGVLVSGSDESAQTEFEMQLGKYHLVETDAPDGYNMLSDPIVIIIDENDENPVRYTQTEYQAGGPQNAEKDGNGVYQITVRNWSGYELPQTGGRGTALFTAIGAVLSGTAGAILTLKRRKEHA